MTDQVVTELIIDAGDATQGAAEYSRAMDSAADAAAKATDSHNSLQDAVNKTTTVLTGSSRSLDASSTSFDKLLNRYDAASRANATWSNAVKVTDAAVAHGAATHQDAARVLDLVQQKLMSGSQASGVMQVASQQLTLQMAALAGGAGPVGVVLSAFGPAGFAAAVALGVAGKALDYMISEADRMGALSQQLRMFADTAGLTTDQVQILESTGARFGQTGDQVAGTLTKFSVSLAQLREGTGPLYTDLNKINPALAQQLSATKDTAAGWNLLATAYVNADKGQQNLLARAVGGRGNIGGTSQLLSATADAGGINGLQSGMQQIDILTQAQITHWATLKVEIDDATRNASNNIASIFTGPVLELEKQYVDAWLEFSRDVKAFSISSDFSSFMDKLNNPATQIALKAILQALPGGALVTGTIAGTRVMRAAVPRRPDQNQTQLPEIDPFGTFAVGGAYGAGTASPQVISQQTSALVAALGPAATLSDKLEASLKKLDAEYANSAFGVKGTADAVDNYNRAVAATNLDSEIAKLNLKNSALGASATVQETVTAKLAALQKQQMQGAGLSDTEYANAKRLIQAQADGTYALQTQTAALNVQAATMNMSAGAAETYRIVQTKINQNLIDGKPAMDGITDAYLRQAAAAGSAAQALEQVKVNSQIAFDRNTVFLSPEDLQIAQSLKGLYGNDIPAALSSSEASGMRVNNALKDMKSTASDFGQALDQALASGKTGADALSAALNTVLSKLASKGMDLGISGLFSMFGGGSGGSAAGIGGLGGLGALGGLFGGTSGGTLTGSDAAMNASLFPGFGTDASLAGTAAAGTDLAAGAGASAAAGPLAPLMLLASVGISLFQGMQAQQKQAEADMQAAAQRASQFEMTAQLAGIDTTTEAGALQAFDIQAANARVQELQQKYPQMAALETELASQRLAIIKQFNDQIIAESQKILDYVTSLQTNSSLSTLSPQDQLNLLQSTFNTHLAAAQGGDQTALSNITQDADALLQSAKSFFASSAGYADIFNTVTAALSNLGNNPLLYNSDGSLPALTQSGSMGAVGMAAGGLVSNGIFGVDSVRASFAGGGDIMLAGGEFVNRAQSVNSSTFPTLDHINRTGSLPGDSNSGFAMLAGVIVKAANDSNRVAAMGFNNQTQMLTDRLDVLTGVVTDLQKTTKSQGERSPRPGMPQQQRVA